MRTARFLIAAFLLSGVATAPTAAQDTLTLKSGGRVAGELINPSQIPRTDYVIRTDGGVVFRIDRSQVVKVNQRRPQADTYERIWPRFADTVEDQWKIAEWCRENTLTEQRGYHLNRILELDPDHEEARRALGYERRGGNWTTRNDLFRDQGYVLYEGSWRSPQEIQLLEEERQRDSAQKEWIAKLKGYRDQLASGSGTEAARRAILAMNDPAAIKALGQALVEESDPFARELFLNALGNVGTDQAAMALAAAYMKEPVDELKYTCLDHLKGKHVAVQFFVNCLNSKKVPEINAAGFALGYLGDPSAIGPLIRSLVTMHKQKIKLGSGQTSSGFDSRGNTGFSAGSSEVTVDIPSQNRAVLDALVKLTGQNYGFNGDQWRVWHAAQRRYEHINPRRD